MDSNDDAVRIENWGHTLPTFVANMKDEDNIEYSEDIVTTTEDIEEPAKKVYPKRGQPGYIPYKKRKRKMHRLNHDSRNCTPLRSVHQQQGIG